MRGRRERKIEERREKNKGKDKEREKEKDERELQLLSVDIHRGIYNIANNGTKSISEIGNYRLRRSDVGPQRGGRVLVSNFTIISWNAR